MYMLYCYQVVSVFGTISAINQSMLRQLEFAPQYQCCTCVYRAESDTVRILFSAVDSGVRSYRQACRSTITVCSVHVPLNQYHAISMSDEAHDRAPEQ